MLKVLFELFVMYLLYKLVFDFIIPIYQTTKQVKQKVGEIHRNMNEQMQKQNDQFTTTPKTTAPKADKDDYIDYEEVK